MLSGDAIKKYSTFVLNSNIIIHFKRYEKLQGGNKNIHYSYIDLGLVCTCIHTNLTSHAPGVIGARVSCSSSSSGTWPTGGFTWRAFRALFSSRRHRR